ncbi:MAG: molybdopterin-synthase adenylyltransferase MoeB [Aquificaceae bacterium]|nr:MAG: molybdopterin-synthase adenylyltransferase MoeB [Aquificaceae bacterium]
MDDTQLLRYSRQILLPDVDINGQQTLLNSKVLIIGMGGLGSPVALYLASAGVGTLSICDFDHVELSNLQRQIIHNNNSIGLSKVDSAERAIQAINPDIIVNKYAKKLVGDTLNKTVKEHDLVIDCSDNFASRFAINTACVEHKTPLVSGAVIRMEGQVSVYDSRDKTSPCYQCLYSESTEVADTCSSNGVLAPVAGIIGSIQATEAIKCLLGLPTLQGRLLIHDAKYMQFREIKLKRDVSCPCCG